MTGSYDDRLKLGGFEAAVRAAALRAVQTGAEHVLGESTKVVPIEEGTLSRSGRATSEAQGDAAVGAVSYSTPYAVRQHEELGYRHDAGRSAKYLEGPLHAESDTVAKIAQQQLRGALGKG